MTLLLLSALLRCMKKLILSLAYKKNGYHGFIFHVLQKVSSQTLLGAAGGPRVPGVCRAPCGAIGGRRLPNSLPTHVSIRRHRCASVKPYPGHS